MFDFCNIVVVVVVVVIVVFAVAVFVASVFCLVFARFFLSFFYLLISSSREMTLVSFMHRPLCTWGKGPSACRLGVWVDPTLSLEVLEKEKIYIPCRKSLSPSL
jgi:hypothetical protein